MDTFADYRLIIAPMIPMVTALLIMAARKRPNLREGLSVAGALLTFAIVVSLLPHILAGGACAYTPLTLYPGVSLKFRLDGLGALFAVTSSFLWIAAAFYCIGYMRALKEHAQTRFYVCYAVSVGAGVGVAFAGSLFTLYLFYELISIFTYPLVMHHQDEEGYLGGRKYIIYLMFTSKAFLLSAMTLTYVICGTLDFSTGGVVNGIFPAGADRTMVTVTYLLFLFGFAKAGIMPLHNWLPDAMVAPTPVSALLHAVVVVKAGVFSICRIMLSLFGVALLQGSGLGLFTAYFVSFTIIIASVIALTKTNLKARLAYSTVSQLSYVILGVAMLTPRGISGGSHAYRQPRLLQDHPLLLRRGYCRGERQKGHSRAGWDRLAHAVHHGCLRPRLPEHDRRAAGKRLRQQMVPGPGGDGYPQQRHPRRARGEQPPERRLLRADRPHLLLRRPAAG